MTASASNPAPSPGGAYLHRPGESELRWAGETQTHSLATGDKISGAFCLVDEQAKKGETVPLHRHPDDMESFYVIEGEMTLYVGDQPFRATPGAFAHIPAGTVHGFRVESERARYLILTTPQHGEFYRAISLPSRPGGLPPEQAVEEGTIMAACEKYNIELIGPLPDAKG